MDPLDPLTLRVLKPLGLPVGSVRALLLLAVLARLILELRASGSAPVWLVAAVVISAVAYFSARAASAPGGLRGTAPLGLPGGTIRLLVLGALGYGFWLYTRSSTLAPEHMSAAWVLGGFAVGVIGRVVLSRLKIPEDSSTPGIYHLQALITLIAAAGLVVLGIKPELSTPDWVQPLLAALTTYYAGAR